MLRYSAFYAMIGYAIQFMIILLNMNFYVRNERKVVTKIKGRA